MEIEPVRAFVGRTYKIHLWEDKEEVSVECVRNGSGIVGMIGPIDSDYPELFKTTSKRRVDAEARRIIRQIVGNQSEYGVEVSWSDNFPIERHFPYKAFIESANYFADILRGYVEPSGQEGQIVPGDITLGIERLLKTEVDPEITIELDRVQGVKRSGRSGSLWKDGKDYVLRVNDPDNIEGETFVEGHEAGHLMLDYAEEILSGRSQ